MMYFNINMTIEELVKEMNNGGNQSELYNLSKINKDVIPYLFKVAGYTREKQKYVGTNKVQSHLTINELIPLAKAAQRESKLNKLQKAVVTTPVVIDAPAVIQKTNAGANITESIFNFANKEEVQTAILDVLDITLDDLSVLKSLKGEAPATTIYEAINKMGSRTRSNKTYYLSTEVVKQVQEFTESHTIKTSQFVEIALIEAIKKYGN